MQRYMIYSRLCQYHGNGLAWKVPFRLELEWGIQLKAKIVILMRFQTQYISKYCQTKYNVNRDKVTRERRRMHSLETESKAEKAFAIITFKHTRGGLQYSPTERKQSLNTVDGGVGTWWVQGCQDVYYHSELRKCFSYEATDTEFSIQLQNCAAVWEFSPGVRDKMFPHGCYQTLHSL